MDFFEEKPLNRAILIANFLTEDECSAVIGEMNSGKHQYLDGELGAGDFHKDNSIRSVDIIEWRHLLESERMQKLHNKIVTQISQINHTTFEFELTELQNIELGRYSSGCHYTWHSDLRDVDRKISRKLSFSILLNSPNEYSGGEFLWGIKDPKVNDPQMVDYKKLSAGSIIVFPSYLPHSITPVTDGVRYQMFGWIMGPRFK
jgi:PKHD-type hydroxylase